MALQFVLTALKIALCFLVSLLFQDFLEVSPHHMGCGTNSHSRIQACRQPKGICTWEGSNMGSLAKQIVPPQEPNGGQALGQPPTLWVLVSPSMLQIYSNVFIALFLAIAVRDKLESLCRELQRQNKMLMVHFVLCNGSASTDYVVKLDFLQIRGATDRLVLLLQDECKRVSTEGQNLRLDLSTRFQDAIKVEIFFFSLVYLSVYILLKMLRLCLYNLQLRHKILFHLQCCHLNNFRHWLCIQGTHFFHAFSSYFMFECSFPNIF